MRRILPAVLFVFSPVAPAAAAPPAEPPPPAHGAQPEKLPSWVQPETPPSGGTQPGSPSSAPAQAARPAEKRTAPEPEPPHEEAQPPHEEALRRGFLAARLMLARGVAEPLRRDHFAAGVDFWIAPVRAVLKDRIDAIVEQYPEAAPVVDMATQVDPAELRAADPEEIRAAFLSIPGLSAEQRQAIEEFDFAGAQNALAVLADVAKDKEKAVTFAMVPYARVRVGRWVGTVRVPLAGFSLHGDRSFELGNVTVQSELGGLVAGGLLGWSWGASVALPTGTRRAGALGLSNALRAPQFLHGYLATETWLAGGLDLHFLTIHADFGVGRLWGVRGNPIPHDATWLRYGAGVTLSPGLLVAASIEAAGGIDLQAARALATHYLAAALHLLLGPARVSVGVQVPLARAQAEAYGSFAGLPFGSPADINVFANAEFGL